MILISIERQKLYLIDGENIIKQYEISTSKFGVGNEKDSFKTPTGIHRVYKKIGEGLPENTVFVERIPYTPEEVKIKFPDLQDRIIARVIWLEGCEEGINKGMNHGVVVDTKERYIYIHGTDGDISKPLSHGCIRMRIKDIVELFDLVHEGDLVVIF